MGVQVDFADWGPIWLRFGEEEVRWFTWIFDANHWSLMQANPWGMGIGPGMGITVQIVEQWIDRADPPFAGGNNVHVHWCRIRNVGPRSGNYYPQAIVAPAR